MRFITILCRNYAFNDLGVCGAVEKSLSNKIGGLPERLCFWTSVCRVRPQMRVDVCLAFHSVKSLLTGSHTHILSKLDATLSWCLLSLSCMWIYKNVTVWVMVFDSRAHRGCAARTACDYNIVFVCRVEDSGSDSGPRGPTALFVFAFLIAWLGAARQSEETSLIIHLTGSNNSAFACHPISWTPQRKALIYSTTNDKYTRLK